MPNSGIPAPTDTEGAATNGPTLSLITSSRESDCQTLRAEWNQVLDTSVRPRVTTQSTEWFDHMRAIGDQVFLASARDASGKLVGIIPMARGQQTLKYAVSGKPLFKSSFRTVTVLGGHLLLPDDPTWYDRFFSLITDQLPDCGCIYFDRVYKQSFCWDYLQSSNLVKKYWLNYHPFGMRIDHGLNLPSNFKEYLAAFNWRKRKNLNRQVRRLREFSHDALELCCVESEQMIPEFLDDVLAIARKSWQHSRIGVRQDYKPKLIDLARRGMLRGYVLRVRGTPVAFTVCYQSRDVLSGIETAYDQTFSAWSPGAVLFYLIIEDLFKRNPPKLFDFGLGEQPYKKTWCNVQQEAATVMLMRKSISNRIRLHSHQTFQSTIAFFKDRFRKSVPS